ncbi:MAG: HTH-type transcriptional regulator DmlR [Burkholderia gladioli]|nr:MAG: HTH-type transcriptional regulator DmlR [Burkholderia gladioli]
MVVDRDADPLREDVDLVIRATRSPPPGLAARRLGMAKWQLYASPAYLDAHGAVSEPTDLARHACLTLGETAGDNRWRFRRGDRTQSLDVRGRYVANDVDARLAAALDGWGIASLPEFAAEKALRRGELIRVLADWQCEAGPYMGPIWLLYPPNRFLPSKVRVLIDYLVGELHDGAHAP